MLGRWQRVAAPPAPSYFKGASSGLHLLGHLQAALALLGGLPDRPDRSPALPEGCGALP